MADPRVAASPANDLVASLALAHGVEAEALFMELDRDEERIEGSLEELVAADPISGLELAAALTPYWVARGRLVRGRGWLSAMLDAVPAAPLAARARAHYGLGILAFLQGEAEGARVSLSESLSLARACGAADSEADALIGLARASMMAHEPRGMEEHAREAVVVARATHDDWRTATAQHHLADALRRQRRFEEAEPVFQAALEDHRSLGDRRSVALELHNLGLLYQQTGRTGEAASALAESLSAAADLAHQRLVGYCVLDCAAFAFEEREFASVAALLGAASALFAQIAAAIEPEYAAQLGTLRERAEAELGAATFVHTFDAGARLGGSEAVALAQSVLGAARTASR